MGKKITIKPKATPRNPNLDDWVGGGGSTSTPSQIPEKSESAVSNSVSEAPQEEPKRAPGTPAPEMKRMTLDVPKELHRRIKQVCAARDSRMVEEIRRILEREFPPMA